MLYRIAVIVLGLLALLAAVGSIGLVVGTRMLGSIQLEVLPMSFNSR